MSTLLRGATAVTAALTLSVVLAACGGGAASEGASGPDGSPAAAQADGPHNEADVTFAQGMLPHHRQAVEMSELAGDRAESPEVLALAQEISAAQEPEIRTLTGFLEAWGAEVPDDDAAMPGMHSDDTEDMPADGMAGMMSSEDMTQLGSAEGADFDRLFLRLMVEHHQGAVDMAETEVDAGDDPAAVALAQDIVDTQEAEIDRMQALLDS